MRDDKGVCTGLKARPRLLNFKKGRWVVELDEKNVPRSHSFSELGMTVAYNTVRP